MPRDQVITVISDESILEAIVEVGSIKIAVRNLDELQALIDQYEDPLDASATLRLFELCALQWIFKTKLGLSDDGWCQAVTELGRLLVEAQRLKDAIWVSTRTGFLSGEEEIKSLVVSELIKQGMFEKALDLIPSGYPDQAEFRAKIAFVYCKMQRLDNALEIIDQVKKYHYLKVKSLVEISRWLREQEDIRSDEVLNQAIAYTSSLHYADKIKALVILGEFETALAEARTAPHPVYRPHYLAELALDLAQYDRNLSLQIADEAHTKCVDLDDNDIYKMTTLETLVKVQVANNRVDEAILLIKVLGKLGWVGAADRVLGFVARAKCEQGDIDLALQLTDEITEEYEKLRILKWIIRILATKSDIRSHQVMERMLDISKGVSKEESEDIEYQLAKALGVVGRFAEAIKYHHPFDSEEFIEDIAKWSPALENLSTGLSLQILERVIRIIITVQPAWQNIYDKIFANLSAS